MRVALVALVSIGLMVLGVRLLGLSRRTHQRPELWLGLGFATSGSLLWMLPLAVQPGVPLELGPPMAVAAQVAASIGIGFVVLFTRATFRPEAAWGWALAAVLFGWDVAMALTMIALGDAMPRGAPGMLVLLSRTCSLLWPFVESLVFARRMQRRLALGLADPVLANRFVLWAVWTGAFALIPLFAVAMRMLGLFEPPVPGAAPPPALRAVFVVLGSGVAVASIAVWLAFFPPARYCRWIVDRAAR